MTDLQLTAYTTQLMRALDGLSIASKVPGADVDLINAIWDVTAMRKDASEEIDRRIRVLGLDPPPHRGATS